MKNIAKKIEWKLHSNFPNEVQGIMEGQEIFTLKAIDKQSTKWSLHSWAFKNELFNNSSQSRLIGEFTCPDIAKMKAETLWQTFVSDLLSA